MQIVTYIDGEAICYLTILNKVNFRWLSGCQIYDLSNLLYYLEQVKQVDVTMYPFYYLLHLFVVNSRDSLYPMHDTYVINTTFYKR